MRLAVVNGCQPCPFIPAAKAEVAAVGGRGRAVEEALHHVDRGTEEEIVVVAGEEVQLANELRPDARPVLGGVVPEVVPVVAHVTRDLAIDHACSEVEHAPRV